MIQMQLSDLVLVVKWFLVVLDYSPTSNVLN